MKQTIYFIRGAPYKYLVKGENLYRSFDKVARKDFDPDLTSESKRFFFKNIPKDILSSNLIFHSPNKRSKNTALLISRNVTELNLLSEINYSMKNFISEDEFFKDSKPNVNRARKSFFYGLINNKLIEKYEEVIKRIEKLLIICCSSKKESILFISHGFFMKVIEVYIKDSKIKNDPNLLLNYFDGEKETFRFCEGFKLNYQNNKVTFDSYIRNKCDI